ncbi:dihydrolipoamide acetyltransferase family protein [Streptomyces sp. NPDC020141]|uniref:dihydrolipoamide acetyltransferase family protein n=1 Tax=Streptomyces sp. NPDC020141 TaxID=3365065 RepID=UPI00379D9619
MAQVLEFRLPDLGEGLTEAEIVRWLVAVGDVVAIDQPVVEVETAKAMVEVPCPYAGVVTARFGEEGGELPVGAPLLTVAVGATDGEVHPNAGTGAGTDPAGERTGSGTGPSDAAVNGSPAPGATPRGTAVNGSAAGGSGSGGAASGGSAAHGPTAGGATAKGSASGETSGNVLVGYGTGAPAARRRRVRPATAEASAAATAAREEDAEQSGPVPVISPLVRRLARDHGLDLRQLAGSGPDGLILRADVEYAMRAAGMGARPGPATASPTRPAPAPRPAGTRPAASPARPAVQAPAGGERIPLRGVRGAVAAKLSRSRTEIPDATCWVDADATELMAARAAMNAVGGPKVSLVALLARICTAALARHPELNSTVDTAAGEIVRLPEVHLGFAAQTERGLVVPVVRDAHRRSVESLSEEFARLTSAAREGVLTPGDLTGGTFTLNNYGVFGVDGSTPIINHPEAAMLGIGRIVPKPWAHRGELAVRQVVQLSLTFDHRVCDGGTAGGFLRHVADCVEQPAVLLRTL